MEDNIVRSPWQVYLATVHCHIHLSGTSNYIVYYICLLPICLLSPSNQVYTENFPWIMYKPCTNCSVSINHKTNQPPLLVYKRLDKRHNTYTLQTGVHGSHALPCTPVYKVEVLTNVDTTLNVACNDIAICIYCARVPATGEQSALCQWNHSWNCQWQQKLAIRGSE